MKLSNKRLFLTVLISFTALFLMPSGAAASIDGGYVGSDTCQACHAEQYAEWSESGHPYKYRTTGGADCSTGDCDPISNILPTPLISSISTLSNDDLAVDDGSGNLDWSSIQYVIGGYGWKARFGILDAWDLDGDGIDDTGYVWVGSSVQYNVLSADLSLDPTDARPDWSGYHSGEDKKYNCGICHNTNGTRDMTASRTEPWEALGLNPETDTLPAGFTSQWTFDGVQCEACHAPGEAHVNDPLSPYTVDTKELCGQCHNRHGADTHGADTKKGYIRHHEQYNELVGNESESGVHASLNCGSCHDPHKRSHKVADAVAAALNITDNDYTAEERSAVVSCNSCHKRRNNAMHSKMDVQCIDCHMAEATKSATAETGDYGKMGDVKTHIFSINPDPDAEDTAATPNSVTGTNVAHNYLTLNYACGKCHDPSMSTYVGIPLTPTELGDYAQDIHRGK